MKKNTNQIIANQFYHIYNKGINGENIFKKADNYYYFLKLFSKYIEPIADTFAYCLLSNHFHFLIRTKKEHEILSFFTENKTEASSKEEVKSIEFYLSNQFAKLFNSYSQAINKTENRTGGLFEKPFRRIAVNNDKYFTRLVAYIHRNPQKHGFVEDFKIYEHSSYHSHLLLEKTSKLKRKEVIDWFGNQEEYKKFHEQIIDEKELKNLLVEF